MFCMWGRGIKICRIYFVCGEGNKNMPEYVLHAGGMKICPDMFCMRGNAEKIKNCEIGSDVRLCYTGIKSFAGGAKISDAVFHARQIGWDALFCRIAIKTVGYCG